MIKLLTYILFEKIYFHFSIGNGQPREPVVVVSALQFSSLWFHEAVIAVAVVFIVTAAAGRA